MGASVEVIRKGVYSISMHTTMWNVGRPSWGREFKKQTFSVNILKTIAGWFGAMQMLR